ncbi:Spermatid-associated protein, partial [Calypte anna]
AMSAFDMTNQHAQHTEPEMDSIAPPMKLRDEMCVFIDGKWMNDTHCQPPIASHQKFFAKRSQNEWSIWEENKALWEEIQLLQVENRMLWEENRALQCLQPPKKTVQVIYTDALQPRLQQQNNPFPFFQDGNVGLQVSPGNKALREKKRVLEDFQQVNKPIPIICKDQKAVTVQEESKDTSSDLQEDAVSILSVEEGNPGQKPQQEHEANKKSTSPDQNRIKSFTSTQGEDEILQAVQDLYKLLHIFLEMNLLHGEKQDSHTPYDMNRSFREDYNKLKQQLKAVKNTVSEITYQMEMLENELIAITCPAYEAVRQQLTTEHQLGEM